jgi:flagellar assembly protein FliH
MSERVIVEAAGLSVTRWQAPDVDAPGHHSSKRPVPRARPAPAPLPTEDSHAPPPLTAEQIARIQEEAREEGFQQGREEGLKAGEGLVHAEVEHLRRILDSLIPSVQSLDREVEQELVLLATTVARQLVRRELRTEPGQIVAVVREALSVLPSSDRRLRLRLHPEDVRIVRDALQLSQLEQPWTLIEEPTLARGGALLETEASRVDATVESRLNAVIAALWGGERLGDERGAEAGVARDPDGDGDR